MAIISKGYDGPLREADQAIMSPHYGADYWVHTLDDFKATGGAGDRELVIGPGIAGGTGVMDTMDADKSLFFDPVDPGTGQRWDLVCLRRNWQPDQGGPSVLDIIKGGTLESLPGTRNNDPGTVDDQPLYLQQVVEGSTALGTRHDLRVFANNGNVVALHDLVRQYLTSVASHVQIGRIHWTLMPAANNATEWQRSQDKYSWFTGAYTLTFPKTESQVTKQYTFPTGFFDPNYSGRPNVQLTMTQKSGVGRLFVQAQDVTVNGFTLYVYKSDLAETISADLTVTVDIMASQ